MRFKFHVVIDKCIFHFAWNQETIEAFKKFCQKKNRLETEHGHEFIENPAPLIKEFQEGRQAPTKKV